MAMAMAMIMLVRMATAMAIAIMAMHMAMGNFLFGSVSDSTDFHVESKRLASQWVVGVNIHIKSSDLDDSNLDRPLPGLQADNLTGLQLLWKSKVLG